MRINDRHRECVSQVRAGKFCAYSFETFGACVSLGLLTYDVGPSDLPTSYEVTAEGAAVADAYDAKRTAQKARANKGAKVRRAIYKDMFGHSGKA